MNFRQFLESSRFDPTYLSIGHSNPEFSELWWWDGHNLHLEPADRVVSKVGYKLAHDDLPIDANAILTGRIDHESEMISMHRGRKSQIPYGSIYNQKDPPTMPEAINALKTKYPTYPIWFSDHNTMKRVDELSND